MSELRAVWVLLLLSVTAGAAEPDAPAKGKKPKALTREGIADVVHEHRVALKRCQDKALAARPGLVGKVRVAFTIELSGKVSGVSVAESTVGDAALEGCVVQVVRGLAFPPPNHGKVTVTFPFQFGTAAASDGGSVGPRAPGGAFVPPPPDPADE